MHVSDAGMIVMLLVGLAAGYLAGKVVKGAGFGLVGDLSVGIVGASIGVWLLPRFDLHFGGGFLGLILESAIGSIVLLLGLRLIGASGWGGR